MTNTDREQRPVAQGDLQKEMLDMVALALDVDRDEVKLDSLLVDDLEADSLDLVDIGYRVTKCFGVDLPLLELRKRFEESNITWLDDEGLVTAEGLAEAEAELPEIRGRIQPGDRVEAIFTVLTVDDLVAMLARRLEAR